MARRPGVPLLLQSLGRSGQVHYWWKCRQHIKYGMAATITALAGATDGPAGTGN